MIDVLIVEDDPMVAHINTKYVEKSTNYNVLGVVHDGKEALDFLNENDVDLIILDVYMPKMNGLSLIKKLREIDCITDVIIVTAASENKTVLELFKLGVVDYLVKPFSYERFMVALQRYEQKADAFTNDFVSQEDIDGYLKVRDNYNLPKGLQLDTLNYITSELSNLEGKFMYIDDIAEICNLGKASLRKYLELLEKNGKVVKDVDYGSIGRPKYKYRLLG